MFEPNYATEIFEQIENEYGQKIERIIKFKEKNDIFFMTIIFSDYRMLEAMIKIETLYRMPAIRIEGKIF